MSEGRTEEEISHALRLWSWHLSDLLLTFKNAYIVMTEVIQNTSHVLILKLLFVHHVN